MGCLDAATIVSGSPVNYVSMGAGGASHQGVTGWRGGNDTSVNLESGTLVFYTVVSGDISAGTVTLRLRYRTTTAANKTLFAQSNVNFQWGVVNFGQ